METYDDYLKRVEPIIDRYMMLEKEMELYKFEINLLNAKIVKLLDQQDKCEIVWEWNKLEKEINDSIRETEELEKKYYFIREKLDYL